MGNSFSYVSQDENSNESVKEYNKDTLINYIDSVVTNYILKQNIVDMLRFSDKEYYDNLILLTSGIMKKQLSSIDIAILKERVKNGNNVNSLQEKINSNSNANKNSNTNSNSNANKNSNSNANSNANNESNNKIYFTNSDDLKEITFKNEKSKQHAILLISKFYVKIMTVFSAITAVIDPQYVYEDEEGNKKYFYLKDFNDLKKINKKTKHLKINQITNPISLVKKRLYILKNKLNDANNEEMNSNYVTINPGEKFCNMNDPINSDINNKLTNEIGIKELDTLYYDEYDYETKSWNKRSEKMEQKYQKDLLKFYQIFTGKKNKPEEVKTFGDIELLKFHNLKRCKNKDYFKDLLVSKNDKLFKSYMEKIEEIQNISKTYKSKLLYILKQIFVESNTNTETQFTLHSDLTLKKVIQLQDQARECILRIYINCEKYFIEALILYETMYENQYGVLVESQINSLNNENNGSANVLDSNLLKRNYELNQPQTSNIPQTFNIPQLQNSLNVSQNKPQESISQNNSYSNIPLYALTSQPQNEQGTSMPNQNQVQNEQTTSMPNQNQVQNEQTTSMPNQNQVQNEQTTSMPNQNQVQNEQTTSMPNQNQVQNEQTTSMPNQNQPQSEQGNSILNENQPQSEQGNSILNENQVQNEQTTSMPNQNQPQSEQGNSILNENQPQSEQGNSMPNINLNNNINKNIIKIPNSLNNILNRQSNQVIHSPPPPSTNSPVENVQQQPSNEPVNSLQPPPPPPPSTNSPVENVQQQPSNEPVNSLQPLPPSPPSTNSPVENAQQQEPPSNEPVNSLQSPPSTNSPVENVQQQPSNEPVNSLQPLPSTPLPTNSPVENVQQQQPSNEPVKKEDTIGGRLELLENIKNGLRNILGGN